jgi:capsular polysaccharide biosynthesis protein
MELRRYWKIFKRRWLIVLIPAIIVLAVGLVTYSAPAPVYNVGVRFLVAQTPAPASDTDEQRYYNWLTSEYIVNGLTDWVRGNEFATAVSAQLAEQNIAIPPGAIQVFPDNTRSMLTLSMSHHSTMELGHMIEAVTTVLIEQNALPQLGGEKVPIVQLDQPHINQIPPSLRDQLDLPLRIVLALGAGIGLALLAEYLDPTVRERDELAAMGFELMGEIPKR